MKKYLLSKVLSVLAVGFLLAAYTAEAATATPAIPRAALKYRNDLIREAKSIYGVNAPIAMLAGQIHQESGWNPTAKSAYAAGLTQFTPDTAVWISSMFKELGKPNVYDPQWAIRALVRYDNMLYKQNSVAANSCDQWAYALTGYNGGQGWNYKDRKAAANKGLDPRYYWGVVENVNSGRRADFFKENRGYPLRIIKKHQYIYLPFDPTNANKVCIP